MSELSDKIADLIYEETVSLPNLDFMDCDELALKIEKLIMEVNNV